MDLEGRIYGLGPRGKGELVRERGRERKRCNNIWEQSQDPKHVILTSGPDYPGKNLEYPDTSGVSGFKPGVSGFP